MILLGIIFSIVFLLIWVLIFFGLSRGISRQGLGVISLGLMTSVFVLLCALLLEVYWERITGIRLKEYQTKVILAPVVEETMKLLFISILAWKIRTLSSKVLLFGAAVGLGFGLVETFLAVSNPVNVIFRDLFTVLMHIAASVSSSFGVKKLFEKKSPICMIGFFLLAVAIHAGFNSTILSLGCG